MRKIISILAAFLAVLTYASLLDHLPQNYTSFTYIYDIQKLYSTFKKVPLGQALMSDLGLEALISSMLETYEIDPNSLSTVKESLFVGDEKSKSFVFAIGPVEKAQDLAYLIQSTLQTMTEGKSLNVKIDNMENYLVMYNDEKYFDGFMKGGGKYEDDQLFHRSGAVGIGYSKYDGSKSFSVVYISGNCIEAEVKILSKEAMQYLKPYKKLSSSDLPKGDVLVILNAENVKGIIDKIEQITGRSVLSEKEKQEVPKSGYVVAGLDVNDIISSAIGESMSGATQTTEVATPNGVVRIESSEPLEEKAAENCKKISNHEYMCEGIIMKFPNPKTAILNMGKEQPSGNAGKLFSSSQNGNEFLAVAWDMSGVLQSLGLDVKSYMMVRGWLDKGIVRIHAQLK